MTLSPKVTVPESPFFYLAGPMRGIAEFNFPRFRRVTAALRDHGFRVVSPHEMDEQQGYFWEGFTGNEDLSQYNFDMTERLTDDILVIGLSAGVVTLPGWERSSGACAEAAFAWATGKPVFRYFEPERSNGLQHQLLLMARPTSQPLFIAESSGSVIEW